MEFEPVSAPAGSRPLKPGPIPRSACPPIRLTSSPVSPSPLRRISSCQSPAIVPRPKSRDKVAVRSSSCPRAPQSHRLCIRGTRYASHSCANSARDRGPLVRDRSLRPLPVSCSIASGSHVVHKPPISHHRTRLSAVADLLLLDTDESIGHHKKGLTERTDRFIGQ